MMKKKYTLILFFCLLIFPPGCGDGISLGGNDNSSLPLLKISEIDQKEMVLVSAGEFLMGTNKTDEQDTQKNIGAVRPLYLDQHPERKIHVDAYYIDRYEVTNREYQRFINATQFDEYPGHWKDGKIPEGLEDHPVAHVTWEEALAYALWAHKQLPTEVQWEKAARGPEGRLYPWGNEYRKGIANMGIDGARQTVPVGKFSTDISPYQVYDMGGNVMEWTADWFRAYPGSTYTDPRFGVTFKVLRGNGFQKAGHYFLEAYRYAFSRTHAKPEEYFENVGFRCATPFIKKG